ncbi:MAG TPA: hypothetical protein VMA34_18400 [Terracidiphilus sp.]|nr:hypothetical protein [Terracidiphilus sp.]
MSGAEFVLWAALGLLFWRRRLHRRFPAMSVYLALHVAATPLLLSAFFALQAHPLNAACYRTYLYGYFAVYIASAALLFFVCTEIFRSALSAFEGLARLGTVAFRWVALVSVIVGLTSVSWHHNPSGIVGAFAYGLMRSVSILELCLLAFLCLCMNALRLSVRDMAFGIALGFGLLSTSDFIFTALVSSRTGLTTPLEIVYEASILVALAIWAVYSSLPEPARKPVVVPASSRIYRWNEIASALGHTGTQIAMQQPANSFFLTDVEKVVEKIFTKNLKGSESEM